MISHDLTFFEGVVATPNRRYSHPRVKSLVRGFYAPVHAEGFQRTPGCADQLGVSLNQLSL